MRATIRKAGPADAGLLDRLLVAFAAEAGAPDAKRSTPADLVTGMAATPPHFQALIAAKGGEAAGLCVWFPWFSTWRGAAGVYVQDLYVVPAARRSGLARRLLVAAMRELRPPGASFIRLGVDASNAVGLGFYQRLGFSRLQGEQVLDLSGEAFRALVAPAATTKTSDNTTDRT